METWKKFLIGVIVIILVVYAPHSTASFLQQAWTSITTFLSSFNLH